MNKKGDSDPAYDFGFYIFYFFILFIAIISFSKFLGDSEIDTNSFFGPIEDSNIANRVTGCLSNDFGEIDKNKFNEDKLRTCLKNDAYNFLVLLDGEEFSNEIVTVGNDLDFGAREVRRYVLIDGKGTNLLVGYNKNVRG
jgi:hypothetical protein